MQETERTRKSDYLRKHRAERRAKGLCGMCGGVLTNGFRNCDACLAKARASSKRWYARHPEATREQRLKYDFGITLADYARMHAEQSGLCAICQKPSNGTYPLGVDHCHKTGKVRGLLCNACNSMLGRLNEDPTRLVEYLRRHA